VPQGYKLKMRVAGGRQNAAEFHAKRPGALRATAEGENSLRKGAVALPKGAQKKIERMEKVGSPRD